MCSKEKFDVLEINGEVADEEVTACNKKSAVYKIASKKFTAAHAKKTAPQHKIVINPKDEEVVYIYSVKVWTFPTRSALNGKQTRISANLQNRKRLISN